MTSRRARLVLVLVVAPVLVLGPFAAGPLWRLVSTQCVYVGDSGSSRTAVRGYMFAKRWGSTGRNGKPNVRHGRKESWFVESGFKASVGVYRDNELLGVETA